MNCNGMNLVISNRNNSTRMFGEEIITMMSEICNRGKPGETSLNEMQVLYDSLIHNLKFIVPL